MTIAILVVIWLGLGFYSFTYWWTKDEDFTAADIKIAAVMTLFGPITFFIGWFVYNTDSKGKGTILIKKKGE